MPRQKVSKFINAIEQGKLSDEEYAILKRHVEKRDREAAQETAATRDDTVQHYCSPCSPNPDRPPDVCFNLENEERMELDELKSSSAGTGPETPGQQCPPIEGIWEQGRTNTSGILTAGLGSYQEGRLLSTTECEDTKTFTDTSSNAATPENCRLKTFSE